MSLKGKAGQQWQKIAKSLENSGLTGKNSTESTEGRDILDPFNGEELKLPPLDLKLPPLEIDIPPLPDLELKE